MYLSRLTLNPRHRRTQSELARPYELHRTIMGGFPTVIPDGERVLYRVEEADAGPVIVIIQSQTPPNWRTLTSVPGYLLREPECKAFALSLTEGQEWAFRLRANPTVKKATHQKEPVRTSGYVAEFRERRAHGQEKLPGHNGIRLGLVREEDQRAWLERQGKRHGFVVQSAQIRPGGLQVAQKRETGEGVATSHRVPHLAVRFDGVLRVTDAALLREAVRGGIGSAKGFGFGLLSLAPPPAAV